MARHNDYLQEVQKFTTSHYWNSGVRITTGVIVPMLIFWFGFGERLATGTSLAAIVIVGTLGALAQGGIYGNVHVATGLWLAIPAVGGVLLGTALQQRISERAVSLLFALLLVVIAIELIIP